MAGKKGLTKGSLGTASPRGAYTGDRSSAPGDNITPGKHKAHSMQRKPATPPNGHGPGHRPGNAKAMGHNAGNIPGAKGC